MLGQDTYSDLISGKWKVGSDGIFDIVKNLYVINRKIGNQYTNINNRGKVIKIKIDALTDISSTTIRKEFSDLKNYYYLIFRENIFQINIYLIIIIKVLILIIKLQKYLKI